MKGINSYFNDFLTEIRLTPSQRTDLITGHTTLRDRLMADENLKDIIITTFLQGSYRRSTAIRPLGEKRADVDVIVVTNLDRDKVTPQEAIDMFIAFVEEHYKGKYRIQGRSIGITLSYVDLDIVITSAPSEVDVEALKSRSVTTNMMLEDLTFGDNDWKLIKGWREPDLQKAFSQNLSDSQKREAEWKLEPLYIPDREAGLWEQTHPLEQISWTRDKNKNTNRHYVNIVKAFKWWRTLRLTAKHPKGYPIEHMVGDNCPNGTLTVADGFCQTMESIVNSYKWYRDNNKVPELFDRGVPSHNVWKRISATEFAAFYDCVADYAKIAREAVDADTIKKQSDKWREIFGNKFPSAPDEDEPESTSSDRASMFTKRTEITTPTGGRFA